MRCQKRATRFPISLFFKTIALWRNRHKPEKREKWPVPMQSVRENTEKRGEGLNLALVHVWVPKDRILEIKSIAGRMAEEE